MTDEERERTREYLRRWREVTGPALERIGRRELREFDFWKHRRATAGLLEIAVAHGRPRTTCGMADFYRRIGLTS